MIRMQWRAGCLPAAGCIVNTPVLQRIGNDGSGRVRSYSLNRPRLSKMAADWLNTLSSGLSSSFFFLMSIGVFQDG